MHKVRLTINPSEEIEIGDEELTDLTRLGFIVKDNHSEERKAAPKTKKESE